VIKELDLNCNTLLPSEPGIEAPPAARPAGPSTRRTEGRSTPRTVITGQHEFTILYSFNDDYLEFGPDQVVTQAAAYAKQTNASKVRVSGYRATSLLSNGTRLVEKTGLAEKRAQDIGTLLRGLNVSNVSVDWKSDAEPGDGLTDPSHRRVSILVTP
jgi:outer membrane protein OmpA-like peptidoglycan-associated protein